MHTTPDTQSADLGTYAGRSLAATAGRSFAANPGRRSRGVVATTAALLLLAGPAAAQPAAGADEFAPQPNPHPDPEVALHVDPGCDPARVDFTVAVLGGPDDRPYTVRVDWEEAGVGGGGSAHGADGTIGTGEGTFELVAVAHYPQVMTEDQVFAPLSISSAPQSTDVTCEPDDGGGTEPDPDPDDGPDRDPDIRTATPTFTG
ncbi:hypothetical protein [Egicoccus sp. AB-alg2]|uniref:hypothetical protein n=1 Tax=Egicoccus sp. AB-alg2 TaxID=3242693 RepID=UPI00359CC092